MSKYYSIHEFSKIIGVSAQTLRNWDANGKLHPHHTTVSGYRYYSDEQLNQVINVKLNRLGHTHPKQKPPRRYPHPSQRLEIGRASCRERV